MHFSGQVSPEYNQAVSVAAISDGTIFELGWASNNKRTPEIRSTAAEPGPPLIRSFPTNNQGRRVVLLAHYHDR